MIKFTLEGKYTYCLDNKGRLTIDLYGESWRDETGDGALLALIYEIEKLREDNGKLEELNFELRSDAQSWSAGIPPYPGEYND